MLQPHQAVKLLLFHRLDTKIRAGNWWGNVEPIAVFSTYHNINNRQQVPDRNIAKNIRDAHFPQGVNLWLDVRCGALGVQLEERELEAAVIVTRKGKEGESGFEAAKNFC